MDETAPRYRIWSESLSAEGPLELPGLVTAVKSHRVRAGTWVYLEHEGQWMRAGQIPELKLFFADTSTRAGSGARAAAPEGAQPVKPGTLRRIKLFADMEESQLAEFAQFMQVQPVKQFATVVTAGEHGDAMFLVLEGELRVRNLIQGRETILGTLGVGEFFGEVSVLDHGPRSADVVANQPSVLLKISAAAVERLVREHPAVAAPFLHGLSRSIVGRMRGLTKKYQDSILFSRLAGAAS